MAVAAESVVVFFSVEAAAAAVALVPPVAPFSSFFRLLLLVVALVDLRDFFSVLTSVACSLSPLPSIGFFLFLSAPAAELAPANECKFDVDLGGLAVVVELATVLVTVESVDAAVRFEDLAEAAVEEEEEGTPVLARAELLFD